MRRYAGGGLLNGAITRNILPDRCIAPVRSSDKIDFRRVIEPIVDFVFAANMIKTTVAGEAQEGLRSHQCNVALEADQTSARSKQQITFNISGILMSNRRA